jgi:hypothetical protein
VSIDGEANNEEMPPLDRSQSEEEQCNKNNEVVQTPEIPVKSEPEEKNGLQETQKNWLLTCRCVREGASRGCPVHKQTMILRQAIQNISALLVTSHSVSLTTQL